jgi:pilus assembly protein Flp/PilA
MGTRKGSRELSHAGGRFAAYSDAARSALKRSQEKCEAVFPLGPRLNKELERFRKAQFWSHAGGTTAIEYALIGSLISIVIVTALKTMGTYLSAVFTSISGKL